MPRSRSTPYQHIKNWLKVRKVEMGIELNLTERTELESLFSKEPNRIRTRMDKNAGHVLRGSSRLNALLIMEGKISGVKARGRPRRAWTDDLKDWTNWEITVNWKELQRTGQFGMPWLVNLLLKKKKKKNLFSTYAVFSDTVISSFSNYISSSLR